MRSYRIALGVAGGLLLTLGSFRLVTELASSDLVVLLLWLVVAVALHDGVVAPLTVGVGLTLTRVAPRARRYVQGALVVSALLTVIAIPLIHRRGTQPEVKALLLRDYAGDVGLLLGFTAAIAAGLYAARLVRDRRRPDIGAKRSKQGPTPEGPTRRGPRVDVAEQEDGPR